VFALVSLILHSRGNVNPFATLDHPEDDEPHKPVDVLSMSDFSGHRELNNTSAHPEPHSPLPEPHLPKSEEVTTTDYASSLHDTLSIPDDLDHHDVHMVCTVTGYPIH
jgi:hypothetical protein